MDCLARNLDDLRRLMLTVTKRGGAVQFRTEHMAFTGEDTPLATVMRSVRGAYAEFKRSLIKECQPEGMALATQHGDLYRL